MATEASMRRASKTAVPALGLFLGLIFGPDADCAVATAPEADRCTADLTALPGFLLENDAGAKDELAQLGQAHFDAALASAKAKAAAATDTETCNDTLRSYLKTWRKGHLAVTGLTLSQTDTGSASTGGRPISAFPAAEVLSSKTLVLRIPSFDGKYREPLIRLISQRRRDLIDHKDWIVDVRGNEGGNDSTYEALLRWLLPQEYEDIGAKWLVTPANIEGQRNVCHLVAPADKICESEATQAVQRMAAAAVGAYVSQESGPDIHYQRIAHLESSRPERVAILFDKGCGSSCEQFLLAVRQSFNVKLVGRPSHGSLDYSNLRPYELPSHERLLWYATSRSDRLPDLPVDLMGIQPDIFLPQSTSAKGYQDEVRQVQSWLERGVLTPVAQPSKASR